MSQPIFKQALCFYTKTNEASWTIYSSNSQSDHKKRILTFTFAHRHSRMHTSYLSQEPTVLRSSLSVIPYPGEASIIE